LRKPAGFDHGAGADRARAGVHHRVDEIQPPGMNIGRLVLQPDSDRSAGAGARILALGFEQQGFGSLEGEVQRAGRDDGGEHRLVGRHRIARIDPPL
jgi:hypothetical protein